MFSFEALLNDDYSYRGVALFLYSFFPYIHSYCCEFISTIPCSIFASPGSAQTSFYVEVLVVIALLLCICVCNFVCLFYVFEFFFFYPDRPFAPSSTISCISYYQASLERKFRIITMNYPTMVRQSSRLWLVCTFDSN